MTTRRFTVTAQTMCEHCAGNGAIRPAVWDDWFAAVKAGLHPENQARFFAERGYANERQYPPRESRCAACNGRGWHAPEPCDLAAALQELGFTPAALQKMVYNDGV